jgi:hypothetical protein
MSGKTHRKPMKCNQTLSNMWLCLNNPKIYHLICISYPQTQSDAAESDNTSRTGPLIKFHTAWGDTTIYHCSCFLLYEVVFPSIRSWFLNLINYLYIYTVHYVYIYNILYIYMYIYIYVCVPQTLIICQLTWPT